MKDKSICQKKRLVQEYPQEPTENSPVDWPQTKWTTYGISYNGKQHRNKKEIYNMNESQKHYAEWGKKGLSQRQLRKF